MGCWLSGQSFCIAILHHFNPQLNTSRGQFYNTFRYFLSVENSCIITPKNAIIILAPEERLVVTKPKYFMLRKVHCVKAENAYFFISGIRMGSIMNCRVGSVYSS